MSSITFTFNRTKNSKKNDMFSSNNQYEDKALPLDCLFDKTEDIGKSFMALRKPRKSKNNLACVKNKFHSLFAKKDLQRRTTSTLAKKYEKQLIDIHQNPENGTKLLGLFGKDKDSRSSIVIKNIIHQVDSDVIKKININILIGTLLKHDYTCWYHYITTKNKCLKFYYHQKWMNYEEDFKQLLDIIVPDKNQQVINSLIMFCNENKLWKLEELCINYFFAAMDSGCTPPQLLKAMLYQITMMAYTNDERILSLIRILYQILKVYKWKKFDEQSERTFLRLLDLYHYSVQPNSRTIPFLVNRHLGLEICIRNILINLANDDLMFALRYMLQWTVGKGIDNKVLHEISQVMEIGADLHQTTNFTKDVGKEMFIFLLDLIQEDNSTKSLLATVILNCLLDRHKQREKFHRPKIFYQHSPYHIRVNENEKVDRDFFIPFHERLHNSILEALLIFANNQLNIRMLFQTLCILIVEVPCSWMASFIIWLLMDIQTSLIHYKMPHTTPVNHLHAIIISVLTLMCWVHSKEYFTNYVTQIMHKRAAFAPHLNPPLRRDYIYADHHVRYFRQDLFIEESEIRLCLLKCFNIKEKLELRILKPPLWEGEREEGNILQELDEFRKRFTLNSANRSRYNILKAKNSKESQTEM